MSVLSCACIWSVFFSTKNCSFWAGAKAHFGVPTRKPTLSQDWIVANRDKNMAINGEERENPRKGIYFCVCSDSDDTASLA